MEKNTSNLFDRKATLNKIAMGHYYGGKKSDCGYTDTYMPDTGNYDYQYNSVLDVKISGKNSDTPSVAAFCNAIAVI